MLVGKQSRLPVAIQKTGIIQNTDSQKAYI